MLSAVLLRRCVLLLGSCNVVAAAKLQPVASGSAGYSTRPYPAKVQTFKLSCFSGIKALVNKSSSSLDVCRAALLVPLHSAMAIFG